MILFEQENYLFFVCLFFFLWTLFSLFVFQVKNLGLWPEAASRVFSRSHAPLQMTWLLAAARLASQSCATFRWQTTVLAFACLISGLTMQPPYPPSSPKARRPTRSMVRTLKAGLPLTTLLTPSSPMSLVCHCHLFAPLSCFPPSPPPFHILRLVEQWSRTSTLGPAFSTARCLFPPWKTS